MIKKRYARKTNQDNECYLKDAWINKNCILGLTSEDQYILYIDKNKNEKKTLVNKYLHDKNDKPSSIKVFNKFVRIEINKKYLKIFNINGEYQNFGSNKTIIYFYEFDSFHGIKYETNEIKFLSNNQKEIEFKFKKEEIMTDFIVFESIIAYEINSSYYKVTNFKLEPIKFNLKKNKKSEDDMIIQDIREIKNYFIVKMNNYYYLFDSNYEIVDIKVKKDEIITFIYPSETIIKVTINNSYCKIFDFNKNELFINLNNITDIRKKEDFYLIERDFIEWELYDSCYNKIYFNINNIDKITDIKISGFYIGIKINYSYFIIFDLELKRLDIGIDTSNIVNFTSSNFKLKLILEDGTSVDIIENKINHNFDVIKFIKNN